MWVTVKPKTVFFCFFSAKCQTVLKIEGVTRGPEVDLETPLRCFCSRNCTAPARELIFEGKEPILVIRWRVRRNARGLA